MKVPEKDFRLMLRDSKVSPKILRSELELSGNEMGFDYDSVFPEEKKKTGFMQRISDAIKPDESIGEAQELLRQGTSGELNPIVAGAGIVGKGIKGLGETALGVASLPTTESFRQQLGAGFAQAIEQDPVIGRAFSALGDIMERVDSIEDPNLREGLKAIGNIAAIIPAERLAAIPNLQRLSKATTPVVKGAQSIVTKPLATAGSITKGATKFATRQITGLSDDTINFITKNADFDPNVAPEVLRGNVGKQFSEVLDDFQKMEAGVLPEYEVIRSDTANKVVFPVSKDPLIKTIEGKGFDVVPNQTADGIRFSIKKTAKSRVPLSKSEISKLEDVLNLASGKRVLSNDEFLNIRGELTKLSQFDATGEVTKDLRSLSREMRSAWNVKGRNQIAGLADVDGQFTELERIIEEFSGDFAKFDKTGNLRLTDAGYRRLLNITNRGRERELARLKKFMPEIEDQINLIRAVEDVQISGGQKVGTYSRAIIGAGGGAAVGGPIGAIIGIMLSSPSVSVPMLKAYGKVVGGIDDVIKSIQSKIKTGSKLSAKESEVFSDAVEHISTLEDSVVGENRLAGLKGVQKGVDDIPKSTK